jgi:hypothetical protein
MTDKKWYECFESSKEDTIKIRKIITTILLVAIIGGYSILIIANTMIAFSIPEIRISSNGFGLTMPTNDTIILESNFTIKNDHWNSFDIRNLKIDFDVYADNDTYLIGDTYNNTIIPRLRIFTIFIVFMFNFSENSDIFLALNETEHLRIEQSIECYYVFYRVYFEIELIVEDLFES